MSMIYIEQEAEVLNFVCGRLGVDVFNQPQPVYSFGEEDYLGQRYDSITYCFQTGTEEDENFLQPFLDSYSNNDGFHYRAIYEGSRIMLECISYHDTEEEEEEESEINYNVISSV